MNRLVLAAAVLAGTTLVAEPVGAQCLPVFTLSSTAPNTGQAGVMFDMEPTGGIPLRIESFDIYVTGAAASYEVWVRQPLESFVGFQSTMAGWTQIGNATVAGLGTVTAVPLNLCLGYTLAVGGRTGFYVTTNPAATHWYFSGTAVGAVWLTDPRLTVYEGNSGGYFSATISPRKFGGAVHYSFGENLLTLSQSGPGVGDLTMSLTTITPGANEGYTLLSGQTAAAVGTGPMIGLWPDALTFQIFSFAAFNGNPFHFPIPSGLGLFPDGPFVAGPGTLTPLTGLTLDASCLLFSAGQSYAGRSNVARITFQ